MSLMGQKIKEYRCGLNKSQKELANDLAVDQPTISQIERGTIQPSLSFIIRFVKKFGVAYEWLLEDDFDKPAPKIPADDFAQRLSRNFQALIKEEKITPQVFSEKCGIPYKRVAEVLKGQDTPTLDELGQILAAFPAYSGRWLIMNLGQMKTDIDVRVVAQLKAQHMETLRLLEQLNRETPNLAGSKAKK